MSGNPPVHTLYQKYTEKDPNGEYATRLWGRIPQNMAECHGYFGEIRAKYGSPPPELEELKKTIKSQMRSLGILTNKVSQRIDSLERGAVETGQQPNCLGGPSFIFNKITYISTLAGLGGGYVPLYYVGDYDSVQAELLNIRVPSPSARGMLITYPSPPEYEGAPIRRLPNPDEEWLRKTLEKVESNYRGLLKGVEPTEQEKILQNLAHVFTIIKGAYYSTGNVADFSTKILGTVVNLEADMGVPMLSATDPSIRGFFRHGYEVLLSEPNRSSFVRASNDAVDLIEGLGYRAQIGKRAMDYVPFFLECQTPSCHGSRVELKYRAGSGSTASVEGKCPRCEQTYSYSFSAERPDIEEIANIITPRVDSRQVVVDSVIPVVAHVGGPGETSYYAEVIPGVSQLGIPFPTYTRYARVFYNTPWNELAGRGIEAKGYTTLSRRELFEALAGWVEAKKTNNVEGIAQAHANIRKAIDETYTALSKAKTDAESEIDAIKRRLGEPSTRAAFMQEMKAKQAVAQELDGYLSYAFGHFAPEKYGQEVSWAWIDLALASGVGENVGIYKRLYGGWTPNSTVFYVNL
ncbi:MAG: bacillithiol biosynthesis BshC [Candidatus Bathyarchaeota archaeon]|nr:bacillithiol biosynthesis BshC [Candidatus Bathyarchaeota archaeon]